MKLNRNHLCVVLKLAPLMFILAASVRWDPASEDSCETIEMSLYDPRQLPFGYKYAKERPLGSRMDDIYEEFKFGGPYRSQFVKSYTGEETRGISTNVFQSCAYNEEDDSTNRMKYYWTTESKSLAILFYCSCFA